MKTNLTTGTLLRKLRVDLGLNAEDVAGLVGVTPRMVSSWESGAQSMPRERLELLMMKLERKGAEGGIVTVLAPDHITVLDVVSERNFAGYKQWGDGTAAIKSLGIDRSTGRPIMHTSSFEVDGNEHVIKFADKWQRNLIVGLRSDFEIGPDRAAFAMYEWFEKRIQAAEQNNPNLRELKDRIAMASHALDAATAEDERRTCQEKLDTAIRALSREIN